MVVEVDSVDEEAKELDIEVGVVVSGAPIVEEASGDDEEALADNVVARIGFTDTNCSRVFSSMCLRTVGRNSSVEGRNSTGSSVGSTTSVAVGTMISGNMVRNGAAMVRGAGSVGDM